MATKKSRKKFDYNKCVSDLISSEIVESLQDFRQHNVSTLQHSTNVSYISYRICRMLSLDYQAAARGGLLHDLYLYDWRVPDPYRGMHAFYHPKVALKNACANFDLSDKEKDIIRKHMWPLTPVFPRYGESVVVSFVDKFCAFMEFMGLQKKFA